jgi:sigma-E factor negative regulatory protein RseC
MLEESGKVVSIEDGGLWVETIQQSTCGSCRAKKGCGQQLLSKIGTHSANIKAVLDKNDNNSYSVGDVVVIGIPENTIVMSSLLIYCLPLLLMIVFSGIAHTYIDSNETHTIIVGLCGLLVGGLFVRCWGRAVQHNADYQPIVLDRQSQVISDPFVSSS